MERLTLEDGSVWPDPSGKLFHKLTWALRYNMNSLSQTDLYHAASVMEAYDVLITHPAMTMDKVQRKIGMIRKAIKLNNEINTLRT